MVELSRVVPSLSNVNSCGIGIGYVADLAFPVYPFPHLLAGRARSGGGAMGEASSGEMKTTPL
jgi:hypothetical protein